MPLDEGDDAHRRSTLGTGERIGFVHLLDERGPAFASLSRRGRAGGNPRSGTRRRLPLGPLAAGLVRIPPVVAHQHLDPHCRRVKRPPVQYYALKPLLPDCAILLSSLARVGHESEAEAEAAFQAGAAQLPPDPDLRFLPLAECNLPQIDTALQNAAQASPRLKQQILEALACAAATDGQVQRREAELVRAIADALNLPLPPFVRAEAESAP